MVWRVSILWMVLLVNMAMGDVATLPVPYGPGFQEITKGLSRGELDLLEEYRVHFAKLKHLYDNSQIEVILRESGLKYRMKPDNPEGRGVTRLVYRANGGHLQRLDSQGANWQTEAATGAAMVDVAGPERFFHARKNSRNGLVITKEFKTRKEAMVAISAFPFYLAPYSYNTNTLDTVIFDKWKPKNWRIERVREEEADGVRLISVHCGVGEDNTVTFDFTFLRDASWALKEYAYVSTDTKKAAFEYDGEHNGIPLLKRATYWIESGPDKTRSHVKEYEVTSFIPGPVAESEFLPEALDLAVGGTKINWGPRFGVLLIGVGIVIVYVLLKRRAATS